MYSISGIEKGNYAYYTYTCPQNYPCFVYGMLYQHSQYKD